MIWCFLFSRTMSKKLRENLTIYLLELNLFRCRISETQSEMFVVISCAIDCPFNLYTGGHVDVNS